MKKEQINFCKKYHLTEAQFCGKEPINGSLDLDSVASIPEGFNPTVGGGLDLYSLTSIPEGFNPIVGGYLDLRSVTSIPKGFNPTVGGYLDLSSLTSIPEGFNPTVGGNLNLKQGLSCKINKITDGFIFSWQDGKYIKIDGILSEVISKKNNVWKVKNVGSTKITYIVSNGTHFSHGDSIKQARDSLMYKISDRDRTKYNNLTVNSILPIAQMIECYRVITGACESGTKGFVTSAGKLKKEYSIKEIIDLTQGQYGNKEFKKFFTNKKGVENETHNINAIPVFNRLQWNKRVSKLLRYTQNIFKILL